MKPSQSSRSFEGKSSRSRLLEGQIPHIFHSNYLCITHKERQSHTYIHPIVPDADRHRGLLGSRGDKKQKITLGLKALHMSGSSTLGLLSSHDNLPLRRRVHLDHSQENLSLLELRLCFKRRIKLLPINIFRISSRISAIPTCG